MQLLQLRAFKGRTMTGRSEIKVVSGVGGTLVTGLPWFVDASVSLWRRRPGRLTGAATWASDKVVGVLFLALLIFVVVGGFVVVYVLGILGIYARQSYASSASKASI